MARLLEDAIGSWELVMLGLTFLGVMYLLFKQMKINIAVSKDGLAGNPYYDGGLRTRGSVSTGATHGASVKEGFSQSGYEAPVFNATAYDPSELNPSEELDLVWNAALGRYVANSDLTKLDGSEGMADNRKKSGYEGFSGNKLASSLQGGN